MIHIPREFIEEILRKEKNHRRFEEFVADLFSTSEGIRYTTTAPTGDKGRDAYAELSDGFAVACATIEQKSIKSKIRGDIDKQRASPFFILRFRYASNLSLSEPVRDEMLAYAKGVFSDRTSTQILGLTQVVDRASAAQELFIKHYSRELAVIESFYRRAIEGGQNSEQADLLRVVLSCSFHPEIQQQRNELIRNLLILALEEEKPRGLAEISTRVGSSLNLERAPRESYIVAGLQKLVDAGEVISTLNGYLLTSDGVAAVKSQLSAAAADALAASELFFDRIGIAADLLTNSQQNAVWAKFQTQLADRFLSGGMRFIAELEALSEGTEAKSRFPEIQTFISDLVQTIEQMTLITSGKNALIGAVKRFAHPNDQAFVWLSQVAVKYLVLCALGLEPEVERAIQRRLTNWIVSPDTHMLLSYLCEGDEGHTQCKSVLVALTTAKASLVMTEAVVEETSHHAKISHRNLDEVEQRYLQARRIDQTIKPFDVVESEDNAFVKSFAFLSDGNWRRSEWQGYIGAFYGYGSKVTEPLKRLLSTELGAEHIADTEETVAAGRGYARNQLGRRADLDEAVSRKEEWDGRLLVSLVKRAATLPDDKRLILVTDAMSIRRFFETTSPNSRNGMQLSRPATLAYALMLAPGSHMNLETLQRFVFAHNSVSQKMIPTLSEVMPRSQSPFKRRSSFDDELESRLLDDNSYT